MKEDRTAFWFRIRVILSTLLVLLGAGLFFAGYYGYAKKWGIPIEVSFFGSGGMQDLQSAPRSFIVRFVGHIFI